MTHVVTEPCIACEYTDCVDVCPTDAFRAGTNMLVIDPDECTDCSACIPECPVEAIYADGEVPSDQQEFLQLNADLAKRWPVITQKKPALPDAEHWSTVRDKRAMLEEQIENNDVKNHVS